MTTATIPIASGIPPLRQGERLGREEFERRYNAMPDIRAELLDGVVYIMSSPVTAHHANPHFDLITWLGIYCIETPGVEGSDNGTLRLPRGSETQPDAFLRILETHGGQSSLDDDGYISGSPELIAEIAYSSLNYDVNVKKPIYQRDGVSEFLLWRIEDQTIEWHVLRNGSYELLVADANGVVRSEVLPGLWLHVEAMARRDMGSVSRVLQQGLASPEHAKFIEKMRRACKGKQEDS